MPRTPDFDALYRSDPDPFAVASSWYEQRKMAVVMAALARPRYDVAWDAAAGTGHLAAGLATRCRRVIATDASAVAVAALSDPNGPLALPAHVDVARSVLPLLPCKARDADLVVVSEVLYYLADRERAAALAMLAGMDAEIVAVQWRHHPHDAYLSGNDVVRELDLALPAGRFVRGVVHEERDFLLTTYLPAPASAGSSTLSTSSTSSTESP